MRLKLTVAVALTAFVAAGGGTAGATGLVHARTFSHGAAASSRLTPGVRKTITLKATHAAGAARGGRALTEKEYWRAQWRDEGAVFPGDK